MFGLLTFVLILLAMFILLVLANDLKSKSCLIVGLSGLLILLSSCFFLEYSDSGRSKVATFDDNYEIQEINRDIAVCYDNCFHYLDSDKGFQGVFLEKETKKMKGFSIQIKIQDIRTFYNKKIKEFVVKERFFSPLGLYYTTSFFKRAVKECILLAQISYSNSNGTNFFDFLSEELTSLGLSLNLGNIEVD